MAETLQNGTINDVELVEALRSAASQLLDSPNVAHEFTRDAIVPLEDGKLLGLSQLKYASPAELPELHEVGAAAFASQAWFEDVDILPSDEPQYNNLHLWASLHVSGDPSPAFSYDFSSRDKLGDGPWRQLLCDPRTMSEVPVSFGNPEDVALREELIGWHLGHLATNPTVWYKRRRNYIFLEPNRTQQTRVQDDPLIVAEHNLVREGSVPVGDGNQTGDMFLQVVDKTTKRVPLAILALFADGRTVFEPFDESADDFVERAMSPDEKTERFMAILARVQEKAAA